MADEQKNEGKGAGAKGASAAAPTPAKGAKGRDAAEGSVTAAQPEVPAPPRTRTLTELRRGGFVAAERKTEEGTVIVTKGGVKLSFPGDEVKAGALTASQLDGACRQTSHILNTLRGGKK